MKKDKPSAAKEGAKLLKLAYRGEYMNKSQWLKRKGMNPDSVSARAYATQVFKATDKLARKNGNVFKYHKAVNAHRVIPNGSDRSRVYREMRTEHFKSGASHLRDARHLIQFGGHNGLQPNHEYLAQETQKVRTRVLNLAANADHVAAACVPQQREPSALS